MKQAIIGIGSNMGDRAKNIAQAVRYMSEQVGHVSRCSSVIETKSWGFESASFLNQIIIILTDLEPLPLLDVLQSIESQLGRTEKSTKTDGKMIYHARPIDLDILDYDGLHYQDDRLTLPHPEIHHRDFIRQSLKELEITIV